MSRISSARARPVGFIEIAQEAGVSVSTVDRVLNERGSVSGAARLRVLAAARQLDVRRILPDPRHGVLHFDALLSDDQTPFQRRLEQAIDRAVLTLDRRIVIHKIRVPLRNAAAYARTILGAKYPRAGLMLAAADTPQVKAALTRVIDAGEAVAALMSDHAGLPRHHYAGIDNESAGRTAGYWLGRLAARDGRLLILQGLAGVPAHADRIRGCLAALAAYFPGVQVTVSEETRDDPDRCYRFVNQALKQGNLAGIYDSGYGSQGIHAALHRAGVHDRTAWVGHEMLDDHRAYLQDRSMDLVIDQNPDGQVQSALRYLLQASGAIEESAPPGPVAYTLFSLPNAPGGSYLG